MRGQCRMTWRSPAHGRVRCTEHVNGHGLQRHVNGDSWISFEAADRGMLEAAWMPSTLTVHEGLPDELGCYYLSFSDDEGWLGGVFVDANNDMAAYFGVTMRGLNPGGEVMILGPGPRPDDEFMNRLLSREDMERLDEVMEG